MSHGNGLHALLQGVRISQRAQRLIAQKWGEQAVHMIRQNPYQLSDAFEGIGFQSADAIAKRLGFAHDHRLRIRYGITHTLKEVTFSRGHLCLPRRQLVDEAGRMLSLNGKSFEIDSQIQYMHQDDLLAFGDEFVYLKHLFRDEIFIAEKLLSLLHSSPRVAINPSTSDLMADQVSAITKIKQNPVFILTGAPGTGKTFTIKRILDSFGDARILMAAPTGKAAKRMIEQTGRNAQTIHKLLEAYMDEEEGRFTFMRDADNPLEADVIILDEVSMLDNALMADFLLAVEDGTRVIFVGDTYQLPSVGPGNILKDMIESNAIPCEELTLIKRQDPGLIIQNCFAGETIVETKHGPRMIRDLKGDVEILSEGSIFRTAKFQSYGKQRLMRVELTTGDVIYATADHEWIYDMQRGCKKRVKTRDLEKKYVPICLFPKPPINDDFYEGVRHGIVFGDGNKIPNNKFCQVFLFGHKKSLSRFFDQDHVSDLKNGSVRAGMLPGHFKEIPSHDLSASYWRGFICGMISTDGNIAQGKAVEIDQAERDVLDAIKLNSVRCGFVCHGVREIPGVNPFNGKPRVGYRVTIRRGTVSPDDLLRDDYRESFLKVGPSVCERIGVRKISETDRVEEVFCCVEPETHTMVISPGILTGQCHHIKAGVNIKLNPKDPNGDFFFIRKRTEKEILDEIVNLVKNRLPSYYKVDPMSEIQVLSPFREKTDLSCASINDALQRELNQGAPIEGISKFKMGDKVIQTKNDYTLELINGDMGYIRDVYKDSLGDRMVVVQFENPDRTVEIPYKDHRLQLAYGLTVHKYQGSEQKIIVIPIHGNMGSFVQRNWLYTAVSRASKVCVLVGELEEIPHIIKRNHQMRRYTRLSTLLQGGK